jgi:hypothetical protein
MCLHCHSPSFITNPSRPDSSSSLQETGNKSRDSSLANHFIGSSSEAIGVDVCSRFVQGLAGDSNKIWFLRLSNRTEFHPLGTATFSVRALTAVKKISSSLFLLIKIEVNQKNIVFCVESSMPFVLGYVLILVFSKWVLKGLTKAF